MKLSILIPMYNAQDYIGNCIDSLLHQNLSKDDYEIIVMDDGSSDESVKIIEDYQKEHKHIRLYKASNSGAYSTRNKLLKLAQGDYIYNLDADDYVVYNCLADVIHLAESNELDIIGFKTAETTVLNDTALSQNITLDIMDVSSGKEFIEHHTYLRHEIWWYFIKKDFLFKHHKSFNNNEYNADVVFTLQSFLNADKVGYIPISIHRYVQTPNSLMRSADFEITRKRIEYIQMMIVNKTKLIDDVNNDNDLDVVIDSMKHRRDIFTFFNIINMIKNPFRLNYIKDKIEIFKEIDAYPIKHFNKNRYKAFRYGVLVKILNNESVLYSLIAFKNFFSKTIKN